MAISTLEFKWWLKEVVGTSAVYDGTKSKEDWNWWGAVGDSNGVSPRKGPIRHGKRKKRKRKRKR